MKTILSLSKTAGKSPATLLLAFVILLMAEGAALAAAGGATVEFRVGHAANGSVSGSLAGSTISISNSDTNCYSYSGSVTGLVTLLGNVGYTFSASWAGCQPVEYSLTLISNVCGYYLMYSNVVETGNNTNGSISFEVRAVTSQQIVFSPDPLEAEEGNMGYASLAYPEGWGATNTWSIVGDTLGCIISNSLNNVDGIIVASTNKGSILVRVVGTNGCSVDKILRLWRCEAGGGGGCGGPACATTSGAGTSGLEGGVSFGIEVGPGGETLTISGSTITSSLFTPASLSFPYVEGSVTVLRGVGGLIEEVKSSTGLTLVTALTSTSYEIVFYTLSQISSQGTNGHWNLIGGATNEVRYLVEQPAGTTNVLRITETRGSETYVYQYTYLNGEWQLSTGGGLRNEFETVVETNGTRVVTTQIKSDTGALIRFSTKRYETLSCGRKLVEETWGTNTWVLTNSYTYNSNGMPRQTLRGDGSWEIFVWDDRGRATDVFSAWLNQDPTTNASLCRLTVNDYSTNVVSGFGDYGFDPFTPRSVTKYVLGQEVERRFTAVRPELRQEVRTLDPGLGWNEGIVTRKAYYTNPAESRFGNIKFVHRVVDNIYGFFDFYEYPSGSSARKTNMVAHVAGESDGGVNFYYAGYYGGGFDGFFWEESQTFTNYLVADSQGRLVERSDLVGWYSGPFAHGAITNSAETYSDFDASGRARKITYLDGSSTYSSLGCCGQTVVTNREGSVTSTSYDALKRVQSVAFNAITNQSTYDAANSVIAAWRTGSDGSVVTNRQTTYDTAGRVTSQTDGLGNKTLFTNFFNGSGYRVEVTTFPDLTQSTNLYFRDGSPYQQFGANTQPVTYGYGVTNDGTGQASYFALTQRGGASEWTKRFYNLAGLEYRTVFASASAPYPASHRYFNQYGLVGTEVDPDGVTRHYIYDQAGVLVETATVLPDSSERTHRTVSTTTMSGTTPVNRQVTTESGVATAQVETTIDGLLSTRTSFGLTNSTATATPGAGYRYVTNTAPDGTYTVQTHQHGRLLSSQRINDQLGTLSHQTYGYDAHGRRSTLTDVGSGTVTTMTYDQADRAVTNTVSATGLAAQTTASLFDNMGRLVRTVEPDGTGKTNEYHPSGLLKKKTGSREYPVQYAYDYAGRMTNMMTWQNYASGSGAAVTAWLYDGYRGFLTNKLDADGKGAGYAYTAGGRLQSRTWARSVGGSSLTTTYGYDTAGDLKTVAYSDGVTASVTNTYDRPGRLTTIQQGSHTISRAYDDAGNLLTESYSGGPLHGLSVVNSYDSLLRRETNGLVNGAGTWLVVTTNGYDAASRLLVVSDRTNAATYSYLATNGLVSEIRLAQSGTERMVTRKIYDGLNRLTVIGSSNSPLGAFSAFRYAYNAANQRTAVTNADASRWAYGYDALGQVTSGKKYWSDGGVVAGEQFEYSFDDIGNRKTAASGGDQWGANLRYENYTANNLNQYTQRTVPGSVDVLGVAHSNATVTIWGSAGVSPAFTPTYRKGEFFRADVKFTNTTAPAYLALTNIGVLKDGANPDIVTTNTGSLLLPKATETFTYDLDGNLLTDSLWTNAWNAENRLVTVASAPGVPTNAWQRATWSYLADGRWSERVVSTWNGAAYIPQYTNRFVWDGKVLLAILSPANTVAMSFLRGLDLSGSRQGAGGAGGALAITLVTNGTHFYGYDGNGNITTLTAASDGSASAVYEYDPFAKTLRASGVVAQANPLRFSTQFTDEVTGDVVYLYRAHRPALGRWLSRDLISRRGGYDSLLFCNNSPVNHVDSFGLIIATWGPVSYTTHTALVTDEYGRSIFRPTYDYECQALGGMSYNLTFIFIVDITVSIMEASDASWLIALQGGPGDWSSRWLAATPTERMQMVRDHEQEHIDDMFSAYLSIRSALIAAEGPYLSRTCCEIVGTAGVAAARSAFLAAAAASQARLH